jgi:predicted nucleic-acid-binding protein
MKESKKSRGKRYFFDTNIFLRVLVREDEKTFSECVRLLESVKNGKIKACTSSLVLAEIQWVLGSVYKFSKNETVEAIKGVLALKNLKVEDGHDVLSAISLYERHSVKFVDTLLASHRTVKRGMPIVSYDKDFSVLDVHWLQPKDVPNN